MLQHHRENIHTSLAIMTDLSDELNELFSPSPDGLPSDIMGELQSMLHLYSTTPQDLFYKWESYSLKMGSENTKLDLRTTREFKNDIQDALERESRGKVPVRGSDKKAVGAASRVNASDGDVFGMYAVSSKVQIGVVTDGPKARWPGSKNARSEKR